MRYGNGRTLHDWQRKQAFGLRPQDKWPDEGCDSRMIVTDGWDVLHVVLAKDHAQWVGSRRALARCPLCNTWIDAGHFGQHRRACEKVNPKLALLASQLL